MGFFSNLFSGSKKPANPMQAVNVLAAMPAGDAATLIRDAISQRPDADLVNSALSKRFHPAIPPSPAPAEELPQRKRAFADRIGEPVLMTATADL